MARRSLEQLYALTIPEVQNVFLQMMQGTVDDSILSEMVRAIEAGDEEALYRASGFTPAVLVPILERIEGAYKDGAEYEVSGWPARIKTPTGLVNFRFNMRNPSAENDIRNFSSSFITRINDEVRQNIRSVLEQGMIRGDNPRQTALNIVGRINPNTGKREGGIIGLSSEQVKWVSNVDRYLKDGDSKYFNLGLRDKRFDRTILKAFESGQKINQDTKTKILTAYKSRALRYRSEQISRTETVQSIERGRKASYDQAILEGTIKRSALTKEWDDVGDGRTRTSHRILGEKYGKGKGIGYDEPFISDVTGSAMLIPGDSSLGADASEIIACRCRTRFKVDWERNARDG